MEARPPGSRDNWNHHLVRCLLVLLARSEEPGAARAQRALRARRLRRPLKMSEPLVDTSIPPYRLRV